MKRTLLLFAILCTLKANAQNYLISFEGSGASTTVSSVKVENLTTGTTLTLNGSDILRLTITTGINAVEDNQTSELNIFPNPMTDNSTLKIYPPVAGAATISVFDMTGKMLTQCQSMLGNGLQEFHLSGLKSGSYLISVIGSTYQLSRKLLCNSKSAGIIRLEKISNNQAFNKKREEADLKDVQSTVDMAYLSGSRLKFMGISGNYSTIITDVPTSDKTLNFNFIPCTDIENNNYSVVAIETQVWMGENLKTTKYNDGTDIPNVTDPDIWDSLKIGAYCDWGNNPSYSVISGRMYNWYAVDNTDATRVESNGGKNVCPTGWHVPTEADWKILSDYVGGSSVGGGKLKETGFTHWASPNTGATNETGFTAIPGGVRETAGMFMDITDIIILWSSSEYEASDGQARRMVSNKPYVSKDFFFSKYYGYSVRCLKD